MEAKKIGSRFQDGMDHVVGTIILGGVGHIGYHLGKVPGVGRAGEYVRENIAEGFQEAEMADRVRKTANNLAKLMTGGANPSSKTIEGMCEDAGIPAERMAKVMDLAREKAGKSPQGNAIPVPA